MTTAICPPALVPYLPAGRGTVTLMDMIHAKAQHDSATTVKQQRVAKKKLADHQHYLNNKEQYKKRGRAWDAANPEKRREISRNYYWRKKAEKSCQ